MLWNSIVGGLQTYTYWETWVVLTLFLLVVLSAQFIGGGITLKSHLLGALWLLFFAPAIELIATFSVIAILAPVLLHLSTFPLWNNPVLLIESYPRATWTILWIGWLLAVVGSFVLQAIPGGMRFVLGTYFLAGISGFYRPDDSSIRDNWPGLWIYLAISIVAVAVSYALVLAVAIAVTAIKRDFDSEPDALGAALVAGAAAFGSFLGIFIYGAWLGGHITHAW